MLFLWKIMLSPEVYIVSRSLRYFFWFNDIEANITNFILKIILDIAKCKFINVQAALFVMLSLPKADKTESNIRKLVSLVQTITQSNHLNFQEIFST